MTLSDHFQNQRWCLAQAAALAGVAVQPVNFEIEVEQRLRAKLRLVARRGLDSPGAQVKISTGPKGAKLQYGLECYVVKIENREVPIIHVVAPECGTAWDYYDFWVVPVAEQRRVYRYLRRLERQAFPDTAPIMRAADQKLLWDNTIGFLRHGRQQLAKFGLPQKRGLVLLGEPGNGKTMACRWLLVACQRYGLSWKCVSAETYEEACENREVRGLFELGEPGIVLFDDLDQALRDRDQGDSGTRRTTFLTELDGLHPRDGVVYVFTSNCHLRDLAPAFRRPGRIDVFVHFPRPDVSLRQRFIVDRWEPAIVEALPIERVIAETEGMSFAEIAELKKLLVLHYLDAGRFDWERAWNAYCAAHRVGVGKGRIGFSSTAAQKNDRSGASVWIGA
ncbi:MAG: AAA family ATPase [Planctomycetaceae bacterium]